MNRHLGKRPAVESSRDFLMEQFIRPSVTLPSAPPRFGHGSMYRGLNWLMLGNGPDESVGPGFEGAGDCVFAGAAHETMLSNRLAGRTVTFDGRAVIGDYSAVTGYRVGDASTDNGTDVRDALSYRRKVGVADAGGVRHKIGAYLKLQPKNFDQLMQAVYIFSAVGIGFEFPESAWDQFDHGEPFDVVDGARVEGGHYVPVVGRSSVGVAGVITWSKRVGMTRLFYETYNDEAWAIVYPEELRSTGMNERGFNLAALNDALAAL